MGAFTCWQSLMGSPEKLFHDCNIPYGDGYVSATTANMTWCILANSCSPLAMRKRSSASAEWPPDCHVKLLTSWLASPLPSVSKTTSQKLYSS